MKITTGKAHDLIAALRALEHDEIKIVPDARLKIAININLLSPITAAYERTRLRAIADFNKDNRKLAEKEQRTDNELTADFADADGKLREVEHDLELRGLMKDELRLSDNPKIGGKTLAALMPILQGVE